MNIMLESAMEKRMSTIFFVLLVYYCKCDSFLAHEGLVTIALTSLAGLCQNVCSVQCRSIEDTKLIDRTLSRCQNQSGSLKATHPAN